MDRHSDRDRDRTKAALVEAVGSVIDESGVLGVGVNAVAKAAGVDKALIYRYFGGLEGLVEAFARSDSFWPSVDEVLGDRDALLALPFDKRVERIFRNYVSALRRRPRTLALLGSELFEHLPLHRPLERAREEMGLKVLALASSDAPPGVDVAAFATLMTGALHYLLARSRYIQEFNGVRLDEDEGWNRLLVMMGQLAGAVVRHGK